jgi:hypothetical protein
MSGPADKWNEVAEWYQGQSGTGASGELTPEIVMAALTLHQQRTALAENMRDVLALFDAAPAPSTQQEGARAGERSVRGASAGPPHELGAAAA